MEQPIPPTSEVLPPNYAHETFTRIRRVQAAITENQIASAQITIKYDLVGGRVAISLDLPLILEYYPEMGCDALKIPDFHLQQDGKKLN